MSKPNLYKAYIVMMLLAILVLVFICYYTDSTVHTNTLTHFYSALFAGLLHSGCNCLFAPNRPKSSEEALFSTRRLRLMLLSVLFLCALVGWEYHEAMHAHVANKVAFFGHLLLNNAALIVGMTAGMLLALFRQKNKQISVAPFVN